MWKALVLSSLLLCTSACAARQDKAAQAAANQQAYKVQLINESQATIQYQYTEFRATQNWSVDRDGLSQKHSNDISFNMSPRDLEPGEKVRLNVFPGSELIIKNTLETADNETRVKIEKHLSVRVQETNLLQEDWVPLF